MTRQPGTGLRHLFPARRRQSDRREASAPLPAPVEVAAEYSTEELQEFLEADRLPEEADPDFREERRRRLWELVEAERARLATESDD
jgi:hypothetical protein